MNDHLENGRKRYAKVLSDYPELKEASNIGLIDTYAVGTGRNYRLEQNLQQVITAALICDNPYAYDKRNVMEYQLEICDTPTSKNFYPNSPISWELETMFRYLNSASLYKIAVERLEQIYFTL